MHKDVKEILFGEEELAEIVKRIAGEITRDYKDKNLLLVCVMKGSICFMADLMRKIDLDYKIEFLRAKSYLAGCSESCGEVEIRSEIQNLSEYDVLIVEDIFDSGRTLQKVTEKMLGDGAKSVKCCSLLDKPERRAEEVSMELDYVGEKIPNAFVVGYGLDYDENYRGLPYVGILKREVYEN
ncbi:MAG: hypoxanthine phosphoribosyltransferase [Clostridia bacterium]|nr:hypoxanthine phosphoribosyltransferase [Clostridia bacterium]